MEEPRTAENLREAGASSEPSGTGQNAFKKRGTKTSGRPGPGDASKASKKTKAFKAPRRVAPDYFVHETDNDMLLIISNIGSGQDRPPRKVAKRKHQAPAKKQQLQHVQRTGVAGERKREQEGAPAAKEPVLGGQAEESGAAAGASWGERLPVEILVRIFQSLVASEGAVPLLCRYVEVLGSGLAGTMRSAQHSHSMLMGTSSRAFFSVWVGIPSLLPALLGSEGMGGPG